METKTINKIGIVYAGCASKSVAQLSFANQIIEKIGYDKLSCVSGSSLGCLNAYACGVEAMNELLNYYGSFRYSRLISLNKKSRKVFIKELTEFVTEKPYKVPTYISCTELFSLKSHYYCLNNMPLSHQKAVLKMSSGFPLVVGPQLFNHYLYLSGSVSDNYPILPMLDENLDMIIILHANPKYYPPLKLYKKMKNTIIIDVDISLNLPKGIKSFSVSKEAFEDMIHYGSIDGKNFADYIFSDFDYENVKDRCYTYVLENLNLRSEKNNDVLLNCYNALNILYDMKESVV